MEAVGGELNEIVAQFAAWFKTLADQIGQVQDATRRSHYWHHRLKQFGAVAA
jgi:hypothetical protein